MISKLSIVVLVWLVLAAPAAAASSAAAAYKAVTPLDYTRKMLDQARTIVAGNQTHDQKRAGLSALFGEFLDTDAMGRESLGQHWSSLTPAQQREFLPLLRELVERAYVQDLLLFQSPDFVCTG